MPFAGLLIAGGLELGGQIVNGIGTSNAANAAQQIAEQQLQEQEYERAQALQMADQGITAAMPTAGELSALSSQLQVAENTYQMQQAALQRDSALLDSVNPAYQSAGQQAYQMMQGQQAAVLQPLQNQIDAQRQQVTSQLKQQYGSGWASSSAGIAAMSQFNQSANQTMSQATMSWQSQLMNEATTGVTANNAYSAAVGSAGQTASGLFGQNFAMNQSLQQQQLQSYNNWIAASEGTSTTAYQGAGNVAQGIQGQGLANMGTQALGMAGTIGGQVLGGQALGTGIGQGISAFTAGQNATLNDGGSTGYQFGNSTGFFPGTSDANPYGLGASSMFQQTGASSANLGLGTPTINGFGTGGGAGGASYGMAAA